MRVVRDVQKSRPHRDYVEGAATSIVRKEHFTTGLLRVHSIFQAITPTFLPRDILYLVPTRLLRFSDHSQHPFPDHLALAAIKSLQHHKTRSSTAFPAKANQTTAVEDDTRWQERSV